VKKIVETVQTKIPGAKVLVMGIFPRGFHAINQKTGQPDATRMRIAETNKLLAGLANGKDIAFLDIGGRFLDAQGGLDKANFPDALHPSGDGYKIWHESVIPVLGGMVKSGAVP
jgi:lysophospholipase L1-like esterase